MASEKQRVIDWFYRALFADGELDFTVELRRAVIEALGKDPVYADAFVQATTLKFWNVVQNEAREVEKLGLMPQLRSWSTTDPKRCIWIPAGPLATADEQIKFTGFRSRADILRQIDELTEREYEALGAYASHLAGADKAVITPRGNEGGVDFFARLRPTAGCHIFAGSYSPVRIVGQCKKYQTKVTVDKIRDFITTLNDIRHDSGRMAKLVPPWFKDSRGPLVGWILSHNGFQSGAHTMANNHGIMLSTSLDIAELCVQSAGFSISGSLASIAKMNSALAQYLADAITP